ncbi:hypothetical protein M9Y10_029767 [Tritrichomonas musculus]|uniref:adenylate cyclase n=1 Tax=Tritrichomonas musculus TaxID=1915356 RepID=A0ABR2KN80_9EUKA
MKDSFSNEVEDLNFVIHDLQYASVLDVPFYTRLLHHFYSYFGKINASVSAPVFLGYIYYIIITVQSFLPAFLIDCEDLWPRESLMTTILSVISYLFQGPHPSKKSARVLMSIVISIIFIVLISVLIVRTQHFHRTGRISSGEFKFIYFTFKYIMPLFCPHLLSGLPISFDQIINQNKVDYNVLQIILCIYSFVFYLYLLYAIITPRVILEDTPSHDWFPLLTVATIANTSLMSLISGVAGCIGGQNRAGCSIWMTLQSLSLGFSFFLSNGVVKIIIGVISSATFFASSFTSLFVTIDLFISKPLSPEILFIVSVIILIALIVVLKILKQMKITKVLCFLESLFDSPDSFESVFENNYRSSFCFISDISSVVEIYIQFVGDFELFEIAVSKWPDNFNLLLLYSRLLAIFPNKNHQLTLTASKISRLKRMKTINTAYLYQFKHLLARRSSNSMTFAFQERIDQISTKTEIIMDTLKRFWENILQKNSVNFWSDSEHVISQIDDLDSLYMQLLDDYPNNYQILNSYHYFVTKIKRDFKESHETARKLEILKQNGTLKSNYALEVALQVLPLLNNCIQSNVSNQVQQPIDAESKTLNNEDEGSELHNDEEMRNKNDSKEVDNGSNDQLELAFSESISHSKLGSIWITCIILIVITVVVIVVFYIYDDYFIKKFIEKQRNAVDFLLEVHLLSHELNFFCINTNLLPLVIDNETETPISITNRTLFTEKVAPELFAKGKIPEFSLTTESMIDLLSGIKDRFGRMVEMLSSLNKNDKYVQQIENLFYNDKTYGSSLKDITINTITIAHELLKANTLDEFFREDGYYYSIKNYFVIIYNLYSKVADLSNSYASSSYDSNYEKLTEIMILVCLIALFFLTLPYLIQLFLLVIQSESIADSFSLLPNTEIRSIINEFGKESSKIEEDTTQVASLNNIRRKTKLSGTTTVLTFLISFIAVIVCSLIIYFDAMEFIDNAESISYEIYKLTPSFATLSLSFTQALRFYMLTHDGNYDHMIELESNLYGSSKDNLTEIVNSAFSMLNLTFKKFSTGMWSEFGGMDVLNKNNNKSFDYLRDAFPNESEQIAPVKTFFEELATTNFYEAISHIQDYLWFYIIDMKAGLDMYEESGFIFSIYPFAYEYPKMESLIYWFSNFSEINRTQIYFSLVQEDVYNKINTYKLIPNICLYIVIAMQILACLLMILFLINRHINIKRSLLFYQFIKPEVILQNQKVLSLVELGRQISNDDDTTFSNANYIISEICQGVVITEKNFAITYFNDSFIKNCQLDEENIKGKKLTDLFDQDDQDKSWTNFIQHVEDSLNGKNKSQFKEDVSIKLMNDKICHFNCTVNCLTKDGVSNNNDYDLIEKVAFVFDDNTEIYMKEQLIMQEKKHLNEMLSNVMPVRMISNFVSSNEGVSFIVQSVSIGKVRIKITKQFNKETCEEFTFYNEIFDRFDTEIKNFDLLTKINSFSHTYSFVGGLFSEINKPERHAEEAIKFALKLLSIAPELSEKFGVEIHLTIGVHTGGPIVAGVISFDNPTFQIIGTVNEMANQVKNKGVPDQICITRAVYELIFSASFKVQEQGDTEIRGGKVIPTYLVRL